MPASRTGALELLHKGRFPQKQSHEKAHTCLKWSRPQYVCIRLSEDRLYSDN
jgi:hypothetical protein